MNTIRFSFKYNKKKKLNKQGEALIQLVAYLPRAKEKTKHRYFSTNIYVRPDQWDIEKSIIIHHPLEARLNFNLTDLKASYEKKVLELLNRNGSCSLTDLDRDVKYSYLSFIEFFETEIIIASKTKALGTIKTYKSALAKLKEYRNKIYFSDLNYKFIQGFDSFLYGLNLRVTVIAKYHKIFRYIINQAIRKDLFSVADNPYEKFKIRTGIPRPRVYLTMNEVSRIENLEFEPEEFYLEVERDAFLFSCYTALRNETNTKISMKMFDKTDGQYYLKTKAKKTGKYINISIAKLFKNELGKSKPELIIRKYEKLQEQIHGKNYYHKPLFGNLVNQTSNKRLKEIAKRAHINKNITTHVGRHTFATFMSGKIPLHYLQAMLQHSSIKTTMIYTHLNEQMIDEKLNEINWE